jgi:hypothetical protein
MSMTPAINEKKFLSKDVFFQIFVEMMLGCCLHKHKVLSVCALMLTFCVPASRKLVLAFIYSNY